MIKITAFNCDGKKIVTLTGDTLRDVLRQIRAEYEPPNIVEWFIRNIQAGRDGGIVFDKISI